MNDRIPPQNLEAERNVIGAMLLNQDACGGAAALLGRDATVFYAPAHQHTYRAILGLLDASSPVDEITVIDALSAAGKLEAVGGMSFISNLGVEVPTSAHWESYAKIVREAWQCRQVISVGNYLISRAYGHEHDAREVISEAESSIAALAETGTTGEVRHIADDLGSALDAIEATSKGGPASGVMTGHERLDGLTWGFQGGDFVVLAAQSSVGKTAFALSIATRNATAGGVTLVFSLEMSRRALQQRVICAMGQVPATDLRTGFLAAKTKQRLLKGATAIQGMPLYVAEAMRITPLDMRTMARKVKRQRGLSLVVVDYVQLVDAGMRFDRRDLAVAYISRSLKALAIELDVPVIALSQINREGDGIDDGFVLKGKLRESAALEHDGDHVLTLANATDATKLAFIADEGLDAADHKTKWLVDHLLMAYEAKHRNGPVGKVRMIFKKDTQEFEEWAAMKARME